MFYKFQCLVSCLIYLIGRWAIVKDEGVYKRMLTYLGINTIGVSRDAHLRSLKLLKAVLGEERGSEGSIFEFAFRTMRERWHKLNELVSFSDRFSLQQTRPEYCNYFGKIRDPSPGDRDSKLPPFNFSIF